LLFHFSQSYSVVHDKNQVFLTRKSKGSIDQLLSLGSIDDLSYKHFTKVSVLDQSCDLQQLAIHSVYFFAIHLFLAALTNTGIFNTSGKNGNLRGCHDSLFTT